MSLAKLRYVNEDGPKSISLTASSTSIGRSEGQDIVLRDRCVSRQHATIVLEDGHYSVIDRGSSRGTFLNGARVERAQLKHGDLLQLGSLETPGLHFEMPSLDEQPNASGSVSGLLAALRPISQTHTGASSAVQEMEQLSWLLGAARQLNAGVAIEDILTTLLELTLQLSGVERGYVFLNQDGGMKLARGLNANGEILHEDSTISRRSMRRAIESEAKFSVSDTLSDDDTAAWASVVANRIRSIYCIPLRKRDAGGSHADLLGLLYLDSQINMGRLSEVDHQLLDTLATEAAALLQNALLVEAEAASRRAREELAIAARIHSGLMAIAMPVLPYASVQAKSIPCYEIGGDFFDALALDDCVCVAIADVSGKGIPAAIVAATMQGIIHAQLLSRQSLPEVAAQLNQFLCARDVGKYATLVLLKLYPNGRLEYLNCGHIQPLLVHASGTRWLEESNLIVGLLQGAQYQSAEIMLKPGERIVLSTDGLVEAENPAGDVFGEAGLADAVLKMDMRSILDHVVQFSAPNAAQDDCTLVDVRFTGTAPCA